MKQILQSFKDGVTELAEVPAPQVGSGEVLIRTTTTLVSAGTERMLIEFGKSNLIQKARTQPDKVRMVLGKARTDGLAATFEAVRSKLDQPFALGYCNVGQVLECDSGITAFKAGDRVVSNGRHAEIVTVPQNLCAKIPSVVSDEAAAFTVLGAIGLQGIRLVQPTLGECIVVTGLGLIGLMTVQMLRAQGCRVLGVDFDDTRLQLARKFGAETVNPGTGQDLQIAAEAFSRGQGVDGVIITAATISNDPIHQAANMCRKRGRIVLVGVVGLDLNRADFYEKELTFQVSCSYGPGRYDPAYEEGGQDYPIGFVRWTAQRNFEAVLDLMAAGVLDLDPLITHRFEITEGERAMALLTANEPSMGILIHYPADLADTDDGSILVRRVALNEGENAAPGKGNVAFLGAGNYAGRVLIPAFKTAGAGLGAVISGGGVSAVHFGKKYGIAHAATDSATILDDPDIDTIVIATRHDVHATQVLAGLRAGKHVFCEKPLCLTLEDLSEIEAEARSRPNQHLMVGFNRRFAPHVVKIRTLLNQVTVPKNFIMTVNSGDIPADHWTQDIAVGGGRIVGECCHFIDLLRHLAGARIVDAKAIQLGAHPSIAVRGDKVVITLSFEDGSVGVINYLANGHKAVPKERLEIFAAGRVLQLENFLRLKGHGWIGFKGMRKWVQNKGQTECAAAFITAIKAGHTTPISLEEVIEVNRVSIELSRSLL